MSTWVPTQASLPDLVLSISPRPEAGETNQYIRKTNDALLVAVYRIIAAQGAVLPHEFARATLDEYPWLGPKPNGGASFHDCYYRWHSTESLQQLGIQRTKIGAAIRAAYGINGSVRLQHTEDAHMHSNYGVLYVQSEHLHRYIRSRFHLVEPTAAAPQ
jgi:hypothetical protein